MILRWEHCICFEPISWIFVMLWTLSDSSQVIQAVVIVLLASISILLIELLVLRSKQGSHKLFLIASRIILVNAEGVRGFLICFFFRFIWITIIVTDWPNYWRKRIKATPPLLLTADTSLGLSCEVTGTYQGWCLNSIYILLQLPTVRLINLCELMYFSNQLLNL